MTLPLHVYLKDLLCNPSDVSIHLDVSIVVDNAKIVQRKSFIQKPTTQNLNRWTEPRRSSESDVVKIQRKVGRKHRKKFDLDVSDHTKKESRWVSDTTSCESGSSKLVNTSSRHSSVIDHKEILLSSAQVHSLPMSDDDRPSEIPTNPTRRSSLPTTLDQVEEALSICNNVKFATQ